MQDKYMSKLNYKRTNAMVYLNLISATALHNRDFMTNIII